MKENQNDGDAAESIERWRVGDQRAVSYRVRFWSSPWLALTALALILLIELIVIAPTPAAIALVVATAWLSLPGVALVHPLFAHAAGSRIAAWLVGPALGVGFSVFGLLLVWSTGLQNWLAIALAPLLTWALVFAAWRWGGPTLRVPPLDRNDITAVAIALLVVPLVTLAPYDHVAERVEDGEAYRAYFTADFVWGMTVTAELAKGDVPPVNPFLHGQPVRYYWMSHLLSGALYRNVRAWGVTSEQVVLIDGLVFSVVFVTFFYWLARACGAASRWAALLVMIGFLANSYEGLERLWLYWRTDQPYDLVKTINIDAVTRWFYQGMPVDGLQRLLLYQPHHLTGYVLALAALWLVAFAEDVTQVSVSLWAGILLGLAFLFSTFTAIILGVSLGLVYLARLLRQRAYVALVQSAVLGAAPVAVAIGISAVLGYTNPDDGLLMHFGLNRVATRQWPFMLLLSLGPLLLGGLAGLVRWQWVMRDGMAPFAIVVSALIFYFTADVPDMGGVWVGWRSGHLLLMAFAIIFAAALTSVWRWQRWRLPIGATMLVACVLALPTVAIDVYNAQDITNRGPGPNFPWTVIITPPEREAFNWIRANTAQDAVVQMEPVARGAGGWAYVPAYAERRMAAGLPISMVPLRPYEIATEIVRTGIFSAHTVRGAHTVARDLGIDYLLVGPPERRAYGATIDRFDATPELFPPLFRNDMITVYRVAP